MVIAGLIIRWILANPAKIRAAWRRTMRYVATPFIHLRALRAWMNWKKVGMKFTFKECLRQEWQKYDKERFPDQPYYRL